MSEDVHMSFTMFTTLTSIAKQIMHYLRVEESIQQETQTKRCNTTCVSGVSGELAAHGNLVWQSETVKRVRFLLVPFS